MIEFTAFKSIFHNKTTHKKSFDTWENFGNALFKMSKAEGVKPKRGQKIPKNAAPLITPAIYKPSTTRANCNVLYWSKWAAMDIDDYEGTLEDALSVFSEYSFYCYSSASSTKEKPKFRVVLNVNQNVEASKIKHFWFSLNKEFKSLADPQTKDLSRMYYVPAKYPNAYNFIFSNSGKVIDPEVFMLRHTYVEEKKSIMHDLPESMQKAIIQKNIDNLTNTNITWTNYNDCPFVNKKMVNEYSSHSKIDGSGRYAFFYGFMLNIASNAIRMKYPITPGEIASLARQVDRDNGNRYQSRPMELEADRALQFIIKTNPF